jgi:hypothetical protein
MMKLIMGLMAMASSTTTESEFRLQEMQIEEDYFWLALKDKNSEIVCVFEIFETEEERLKIRMFFEENGEIVDCENVIEVLRSQDREECSDEDLALCEIVFDGYQLAPNDEI